jgi:hypothetical protein
MHLSPRKKFVISSIMLLILTAILIFAFITVSNNVHIYRAMLGTTAAKISSGEKEFNRIVKISDLIKDRAHDIQRIRQITIDSRRPLKFIETIEHIGRITNVKVALTVDEKRDEIQALIFHATLQGTEKDIRAMLALIQQLPYQIKIANISFQRDVSIGVNQKQAILSTMTRLILTMRVATQ